MDGPKKEYPEIKSGFPAFDEVITRVKPGDNIILQIGSIKDYLSFVHPFCYEAIQEERPLIYFRFAQHEEVIPPDVKARTYRVNPELGFEPFITSIFDVIEEYGYGACYIFDSLSELLADWYSDRMLSNFFMLTCPYLYYYETITYFALFKNQHTDLALNAIHDTAQVIVDVYRNNQRLYIQPLKVDGRFSETMYSLHEFEKDRFEPVTASATISEIFSSISHTWINLSIPRQDKWSKTFASLYNLREESSDTDPEISDLKEKLLRIVVSRDNRFLKLASKFFTVSDIRDIAKRMIGTGLIGGKTAGMLIARAILRRNSSKWQNLLEEHDSFFIGSDVFYTYTILNDCWWPRRKLKKGGVLVEEADELADKMMSGYFPDEIRKQFADMLDYFGQVPIIVRSSSILEDAYGNAFSGKYESVFCANQGPPEERLKSFMDAVRTVYASTLKKEALLYREHFGLLEHDEQMALLIQRVSGDKYKELYFPQVAGVGFSFNPYVWDKEIEPEKGMLRLVFGLGTRAVDRADDDYTRVIALSAPNKRPEHTYDEVHKYSQKKVDVLDLKDNRLVSSTFEDVAEKSDKLPLDIFASRDKEIERRAREHNLSNVFSYILTFDKLLSGTEFVDDMRGMLKVIEEGYEHPVDIEFTLNFLDHNKYKINLVQCRPFQVKCRIKDLESRVDIKEKDIVLKTSGPIIGNSIASEIDWIIYIPASEYSRLSVSDRYAVARFIGEITHISEIHKNKTIALVGPGRWGTTSPSLGIPISFSEINTVSIICEIAEMHEGLVPDISLGTHFFNDLVEMDILYLALYPEREGYAVKRDYFERIPNSVERFIPSAVRLRNTVKLIDLTTEKSENRISIHADALNQKAVFYSTGDK